VVGDRALTVVAELAGIAADTGGEALVLGRDAAFDIDRIGYRRIAVAAAVHHRDLVADDLVGDAAERMDTPVGRRAKAGAIRQGVFIVAIAIDAFGERNPRRVGSAEPDDQRRVELGLDIGLLDIEPLADKVVVVRPDDIVDVGSKVYREHIVELVVDADIEALDREARAARGGLHVVRLLVDVAEVPVHPAADLGVVEPLRLRLGLGGQRRLHLLRNRSGLGGHLLFLHRNLRLRLLGSALDLLLIRDQRIDLRLQNLDFVLQRLDLRAVLIFGTRLLCMSGNSGANGHQAAQRAVQQQRIFSHHNTPLKLAGFNPKTPFAGISVSFMTAN